MRYAIVIEKAEGNYSAYVPDLPGCVATGPTVAKVESEIREVWLPVAVYLLATGASLFQTRYEPGAV